MVDDDDCKDQKEITEISWRSLIVSADKERTADRLDPNISYVVVTRLIGFQGRTLFEIQTIEDTEEDEIGKHHNINSISDYLPIHPSLQRENIGESGRIWHRSQTLYDDVFNKIEAIATSGRRAPLWRCRLRDGLA